ncbi:MAG: glycosyltransferase [Archangiaceae bacterium]|nr:glycosyltransferase [Archangiaceae bacterium]
MTVLRNAHNQGYGGNQKVGYSYAVNEGFDFVAMVHGDGQYAPEQLPNLMQPLVDGQADVVFGSRMMTLFGSLKGGMPLCKWLGKPHSHHRAGTRCRARSSLSSTPGYRICSTAALEARELHAQLERLPLRHRDHHSDAQRRSSESSSCRFRPTTATRSAG